MTVVAPLFLWGCPSKDGEERLPQPTATAPPLSPPADIPMKTLPGWDDPPASAWNYSGGGEYAGLAVHHRGTPLAEARSILIFFHGYGAEGDDLVPLSDVIQAGPDAAFLFPEAPVALRRGGRAWFRRDQSNFPEGVHRARLLLHDIVAQHPNQAIIVGGFSQGAMLTANLIDGEFALRAAIVWSPADLLLAPLTGTQKQTPIFLSHGDVDPILPFAGGKSLGDQFTRAGYPVTWVPFHGRHAIPRAVIEELNRFLQKLQSTSRD